MNPLPRRILFGGLLLLVGAGCRALPQSRPDESLGEPTVMLFRSAFPSVSPSPSYFDLFNLDGMLLESKAISGLVVPIQGQVQAVGESIYVLRQDALKPNVVVRLGGAEDHVLGFMTADNREPLAFIVSPDEETIAWVDARTDDPKQVELWVSDLDGGDRRLALEAGMYRGVPVLPMPIEWDPRGDLIFSRQIGELVYVPYFGFDSLYAYSWSDERVSPIVQLEACPPSVVEPRSAEEIAPGRWFAVSPDGTRAVGACSSSESGLVDRLMERDVSTAAEVILPARGQQDFVGGAAYSPSGEKLAFSACVQDESFATSCQLAVLPRGQATAEWIAVHESWYITKVVWIDEERLLVESLQEGRFQVEIVGVQGNTIPIGDGPLVGLTRR